MTCKHQSAMLGMQQSNQHSCLICLFVVRVCRRPGPFQLHAAHLVFTRFIQPHLVPLLVVLTSAQPSEVPLLRWSVHCHVCCMMPSFPPGHQPYSTVPLRKEGRQSDTGCLSRLQATQLMYPKGMTSSCKSSGQSLASQHADKCRAITYTQHS